VDWRTGEPARADDREQTHDFRHARQKFVVFVEDQRRVGADRAIERRFSRRCERDGGAAHRVPQAAVGMGADRSSYSSVLIEQHDRGCMSEPWHQALTQPLDRVGGSPFRASHRRQRLHGPPSTP
jgi:hypothetical protein